MKLRSKVAKKAARIVRMAQAEKAIPSIVDEGPEKTPAIGVPPVDEGAIEEDVEKEIKHEKKEEAELESFGDKLDKLNETLETVVDALADQKKVLEKTLLDDTEPEKDFEEFKEDEEESDEEEFSSEEFGIDEDSLVLSNKESAMSTKLREARNARLSKKATKEAAETNETLSDMFELEKAKKKTFKPSAPAPTITKVKKSEVPEMLKLAELAFELNKDASKWTVLKVTADKEIPLYEIAATEETKDKFATEDFANELIDTMKEHGVEKTLEHYNAIEVEDTIEATEETPNETTEGVTASIQDEQRRFVRAFRLALVAMQKNLIKNPLKAAFFENLKSLGVDEGQATRLIEASFAKGAGEQFETAIATTEELLDMSDEAFIEYESLLGKTNTEMPQIEEGNQISEHASDMRKRASKGSLPIETASQSDPTSMAETIANLLPKPNLAGISKFSK